MKSWPQYGVENYENCIRQLQRTPAPLEIEACGSTGISLARLVCEPVSQQLRDIRTFHCHSSPHPTPPPSMNSSIPSGLPSEIFDNIIGRVEGRNNLKSLRLTCRALNSFATRWLFRDIYISICSLRADDRFQKLIEKYGHLVRELDVDGIYGPRSDCLCPFEVTPFLERMPFLQEIRMRGTYHSWFHDEIQSEGFLELLRRASLQTSPQDRVLQNLRCCKFPTRYLFLRILCSLVLIRVRWK